MNALVKEITELKNIKTATGLISLSFRCGVKLVTTCKVPQYVEITCKKSHVKGSLEKISREYGLQPELLKGEIEQSIIEHKIMIENSNLLAINMLKILLVNQSMEEE